MGNHLHATAVNVSDTSLDFDTPRLLDGWVLWRVGVHTNALRNPLAFLSRELHHLLQHRLRCRCHDGSLLSCVNLGPLQLVAVVHIHALPCRVEIQRAGAAFAVAVAGLLYSAEG